VIYACCIVLVAEEAIYLLWIRPLWLTRYPNKIVICRCKLLSTFMKNLPSRLVVYNQWTQLLNSNTGSGTHFTFLGGLSLAASALREFTSQNGINK